MSQPNCPQCGTGVAPDWDWCHRCGYDPDGLRQAVAPPPPPPPPPPLGVESTADSSTSSISPTTATPGPSIPAACSAATAIMAAAPDPAAGGMVADATGFRFPTGGLGIYGTLRPDNNEPLPTAAEAAGWFTADTREQLTEAIAGLSYVNGDRAEWTAGNAVLHIIIYQFDSAAHAVAFVQDYMAASCGYLSNMRMVPGATDGVSFVSTTAGEPEGRVLMVVGPNLVSLSTCGCEEQMQSAAEGWAASVNATYAAGAKP